MQLLKDYIKENYGGVASAFAKAHNQHLTMVYRWQKSNDVYVSNGDLVLMRTMRSLVLPAMVDSPSVGAKYWHHTDVITKAGVKAEIHPAYWTGQIHDITRLELSNVFINEASARAALPNYEG